MTNKKENMFASAAAKRKEEQQALEAELKNTTVSVTNDNSNSVITSSRKVPMNITLPPEYKEKLMEYSKRKHLSSSVVIQIMIDKYCN